MCGTKFSEVTPNAKKRQESKIIKEKEKGRIVADAEKSKRIGISLEVAGVILLILGIILWYFISRLFPKPGLGGIVYNSFFLISIFGGILIIFGLCYLGEARK